MGTTFFDGAKEQDPEEEESLASLSAPRSEVRVRYLHGEGVRGGRGRQPVTPLQLSRCLIRSLDAAHYVSDTCRCHEVTEPQVLLCGSSHCEFVGLRSEFTNPRLRLVTGPVLECPECSCAYVFPAMDGKNKRMPEDDEPFIVE